MKNRFGSATRLGLTGLAALALVVAVSASSSKNTDQSKKSTIDAASSSLLASSKTVAARSGPPVVSSGPNKLAQSHPFPAPDSTQTILYDQTDNPAANSTVSQNFEPANDAFDNQLADDFVVPAGGWTIGQVNVLGVYFNGPGPATDVNVFFYADAAGLPGAVVPGGTYLNAAITSGAATGAFQICLPASLTLAPGHYWVSVQANLNFTPGGEWGWTDRVVTSNSPAAWQNPGAGFGTPCTAWGQRGPGCGIDPGNNDQLFQLLTPPAGGCPVSIVCPPCGGYSITTSTGNAIVPGATDIGNHCDDCPSPVTLPFPVTLYGTTYPTGATVQVSSNGSVDFIGTASPFGTSCPLPDSRIDRSILPFQGDLYTINAPTGIFTSVTGTAPNRDFNIEWRAQYFPGSGNANFEVVLHENTQCFDVIYGATDDSGSAEESGVQKSPTGPATQFSCLAGTLTSGLKVTYCPNTCPAPVPTSAVSRKVHGGAGTFDINLPLVPIGGAVGIEDRTQGAGGSTCGAWQVRTPFPAPTSYGGSATSDGTYAYVAGGYSFDTSTAVNIFQRYNPTTDTWTVLAPMPDAEAETSAVYSPVNNKVYVFGGDDPVTGINSNATRIYDIGTNTWSAGMNMPDLRSFMASGYYNGKIYLVGGYNTGNVDPSFGQVWEYDPVLNTWNTSRASMPITMGGPGFGIINGHIYVAGGRNLANTNLNTLYDYNIGADTWTPRANLPAGINVPGSGVVNGQLAVFGGGNPFAFTPDTTGANVLYDPASDTWATGPTLNQIRSFPAGTAVGNTLVAAGGYTGVSTTGSTETTACGTGAFAHQMVITFATPVAVESVAVTAGTGTVGSFSVSGNVVTVNLTGVTNAQRLGVTLQNVCDGTIVGDVLIPMGVLSGDTNANAAVNAGDAAQTKGQSGVPVGAGNFRTDVNANGSINAGDVAIVKGKAGTSLPP